jgi:hypothetical protein
MTKRLRNGLCRSISLVAVLIVLGACASSSRQVLNAEAKSEESGPTLRYVKGPPLAEGTWKGQLDMRTIPDVENEGPWKYDAVLKNCGGQVRIYWVQEDGSLGKGRVMEVVQLFPRIHLLSFANLQKDDPIDGGAESQLWTLVDARPKGWTLSLSRAVVNAKSQSEGPWYTFRWIGVGSMDYVPNSCD